MIAAICGRGLVEFRELCAHLARVWVAELVENGQGLAPGLAGGVVVTSSAVGVTQVPERLFLPAQACPRARTHR